MKNICISLLISVLLLSWVALLESEVLTLDIILTNDMHGGIDKTDATFINPTFPPRLGGGASAATYIKDIRSKQSPTRDNLLLDTGDFFQGRPIGTMTEGQAIVEYMNMIQYDLLVLGNHEYDLGEDILRNLLKNVQFPVLGANVFQKGSEDLVNYVQPYLILHKMGIKIGIVGITTTDTAQMSFMEHISGVEFRDEKEYLTYYVNFLRNEEKVDLVIATVHAGIPYDPQQTYRERYGDLKKNNFTRRWGYDAQELAHEVPGIDLIFAGHIHVGFAKPWVDPNNHTLVFQNYAYLSNIMHFMIQIDAETKSIMGYDTPTRDSGLITLFADQFIPDPEFDHVITAQQKAAEKGMDDVIGQAAVFLSRSSIDAQNVMGNFTCEAMKSAVDADFAFINLGGIRAEIPLGNVTYRHVFNAMPFDNMIVTLLVDGNFLKKIIETRVADTRAGLILAGGKVIYSRTRENFDRVTHLEINGEIWEPDRIYRVATTDFLLSGNAGLTLLTNLPEEAIIRHEINLRDAMADYFRKYSPVRVEIDDRWKRDDRSIPKF